MRKPFPVFPVDAAPVVFRPADHPTPESVGFEIGLTLAVMLAIAGAVPLVLSLCGLE